MRAYLRHRRWRRLCCVVACSLACAGDPAAPVVPDPAVLYATLRLEHKAIVLSLHKPYDTVQLRATPYNLLGEEMDFNEAPVFRRINLLDTAVNVDAAGHVTARMSTSGTKIEVGITIDGVTRTDTATVMVRSEFPVRQVARMEFFPIPPDSSWLWAGVGQTFNGYTRWVRFFDSDNQIIQTAQQLVSYRWDDDRLIKVDHGIKPNRTARIGETFIHAETYAYGRSFHDSVLFRRVMPKAKFVVVGRVVPVSGVPTVRFFPDTLRIQQGTTVFFINRTSTVRVLYPQCDLPSCMVTYQKEYPGSILTWVDSVDVQFEAAETIVAGDSYGNVVFENSPLPMISDGGHGNIAAFSHLFCQRATGASVDDRCAGLGSGEIDAGIRARKFPVPGVYPYKSLRFPDARGVIVVEP